jgi:ankyrin repeat protein
MEHRDAMEARLDKDYTVLHHFGDIEVQEGNGVWRPVEMSRHKENDSILLHYGNEEVEGLDFDYTLSSSGVLVAGTDKIKWRKKSSKTPCRFRKGDRVLCLCNGWLPGVVTVAGYKLDESDCQSVADEEDPEPGDVIPYQVRLTGGNDDRLIFVPQDDDTMCCALDADNIVIRNVSEGLLDTFLWPLIRKRPEEANRLLRRAVSHRLLRSALWITRRAKIPTLLIGLELLRLAVQCKNVKRAMDEDDERGIMQEFDQLFNWLKTECGAPLDSYQDEQGRHAEHVAVINGDSVFLYWLLNEDGNFKYTRGGGQLKSRNAVSADTLKTRAYQLPVDSKGRTPLHYVAIGSQNQPIIIKTYLRGMETITNRVSVGFNSWIGDILDFDAVDADGKTALEYANDSEDMIKSLGALRQQIHQGRLNFRIKNGGNDEASYIEILQFTEEHGLDLSRAITDTAPGSARDDDAANRAAAVLTSIVRSIEEGKLFRLQFLLKGQNLDVSSLQDEQGLSLLHISAGRTKEVHEDMVRRAEYLLRDRDNEDDFKNVSRSNARNEVLFQHFFLETWNGDSDLLDALIQTKTKDEKRERSNSHLQVERPEDRCMGYDRYHGGTRTGTTHSCTSYVHDIHAATYI